MNKTFTRFILLVVGFVGSWLLLAQIDWMTHFGIREKTDATEKALGDLYWESIKSGEIVIEDEAVVEPVDQLLTHICKKNGIDRSEVKLHVIQKSEINAFALPDGHMVILTGLINFAEHESELAGVIGHELAHIQRNHIMKTLIKEVGLSVLVSMTTGDAGGVLVQETLRTLTSSAYSRKLEAEADKYAVKYLAKADMNPEGLANFLYRLAEEAADMPEILNWVSTHPETKARAVEIVNHMEANEFEEQAVLDDAT
ncbi:MAG: M48 family metallopeptidase, partial [Flammeovirgaceae bacterium]